VTKLWAVRFFVRRFKVSLNAVSHEEASCGLPYMLAKDFDKTIVFIALFVFIEASPFVT
jgi:hypothetical protein